MTQTLQLEHVRVIAIDEGPRLLVEWSPRWHEFVTSIGPAFSRSGPRLAGEAPHGVFPYRGLIAALLLEAFLLFAVMVLPRQIYRLRPYAAPRVRPYEVIYYSGDELPRTEDMGGAESGKAGRAGGEEARHRTQTIHVARGKSLVSEVVDAPALKLPASNSAVANLLAFKTNPGPLPAEGSPRPSNIAREQSRIAPSLNSVTPPSPSIAANMSRAVPALNAAVVPPAPTVQSEHTLYAPVLTARVVAPSPMVSRDRSRIAPSSDARVIDPASSRVIRDNTRSAPALNGSVIPPAPAAVSREVSPSRVQMNNAAVVPPPVSAPERESTRMAKLHLPTPSVVTPPPSADSSRELRRLESGGAAPSPTIVSPPPSQPPNTGFVSSVIGKLFGTQDVVPPPPSVSGGTASTRDGSGRNPNRGGEGSMVANVVPPPPSSGGAGWPSGSANSTATRGSSNSNLGPNVVPPPPSVGGAGGAGGNRSGSASGMAGGLTDNIVAPPPTALSGSGLSGTGRTGAGLGGPGDIGSVLAPPKGAVGNRDNSGILISSQPGSDVGMPGSGGKGSIALSPSGGDKPGFGGAGGGAGVGHGEGSGSGISGAGEGAGKTGSGHGFETRASGGISPVPGPGGAGSAPTGSPAVPGVDVRGGSTVVNLPSFGAEGGSAPTLPGRTSVKDQQGPSITIVASSRSGGAFDFYGKLPGDNYTVYVDTSIGTVVMQFAEAVLSSHSNNSSNTGALTGPQGIRNDLPADLPRARVVIKGKLDASGNLRNLQVVEPGPAAMTAKIMAALPSWKFRPAMRGAQPVEVNAILGFNIDTNDRN